VVSRRFARRTQGWRGARAITCARKGRSCASFAFGQPQRVTIAVASTESVGSPEWTDETQYFPSRLTTQ